jgi:hypothetical protein
MSSFFFLLKKNVKFNQWSVPEVPFPEAAASVCRRGQVLPTAGPKMARSGWSTDASDGSVTCTTGGAQDVPSENMYCSPLLFCKRGRPALDRGSSTTYDEQDIFLQ